MNFPVEIEAPVKSKTRPSMGAAGKGNLIDSGFVLINMPFASTNWPSIQLGLLQAIAEKGGYRVPGSYANMAFSQAIGPKAYSLFSDVGRIRLGEWIFTKAAFPDHPLRKRFVDEYRATVESVAEQAGMTLDEVVSLHEDVAPSFVETCAQSLFASGVRAVGFTSTFEQNVASIALARALKALDPNIITVFGGSNYDGGMGLAYLRGIEHIDAIACGEADGVFVPLVESIYRGEGVPELPGLVTREKITDEKPPQATFMGLMDELPTPNYDDFFRALTENSINPPLQKISLPIESSRGCWWGEKNHCTFCGLNGLAMTHRSKTVESVIDDIERLSQRYGQHDFMAVDNIIGIKLMEDLTTIIAEKEYGYRILYEIKSNLTREKIRKMKAGGIHSVQPGIESLSSHVLKLMKKGVRGIHNVQTLKWMRYYEMEVLWFILHGFPGELEEDYAFQADVMNSLHHLMPPGGMLRIWLERFSPNFEKASEFGFTNVRPDASYKYVYPDTVDLDSAAYFFEYEAPNTASGESVSRCYQSVNRWREKWNDSDDEKPFLRYHRIHSGIKIEDGRDDPGEPRIITYRGLIGSIYLICDDAARSFSKIKQEVEEILDEEVDEAELHSILQRFVDDRVMMVEGNYYLSLALPAYRKY